LIIIISLIETIIIEATLFMFRSLGKSKIAFVLAILFGISLFFFKGGERYSNLFNSDNIVASVSGTPISTSKFLRVMQININQYNQMFGRNLTNEEIKAFQIHSTTLGNLINGAVYENEFDTQNFIIDETVVASETKKRFPNLYNKNNKLDELALKSFLKQQNLKIDDFVKIIDYETRARVFDKLFFQVDYPKKMEDVINQYNNHSRNVNLIKLNINDFELKNYNELNISEENNEIIDYYKKNINSYLIPEKRNISYILINKDDYKNEFMPSDSQILNYYNNNKNLFLNPEKRDFIQFNFKNLEEANEFKKNISSLNNENIIKFAEKNNVFFNEFSNVSKNEVLEDLSNIIFSLQENEVSKVVETVIAKHIVIVNKIYPEFQKNIDESKEEISKTLLEVELDGYLLDLKNKINQQILDGFSLKEIASDNALIINTINNAERLNKVIENDLVKSEVIAKGFATNKDFVSDLVEINDNKAIVINVDTIENEKPYTLNEIFKTVSNDWIKSIKIKNIEDHINEVNKSSKSLDDILLFVGTKIDNIEIKMDNIDYPSKFKNSIFNNDINKISLSVESDEIYISKINSINFPEKFENNQILSMISELRGNFGAEIFKDKNISTNDNLIEALISQY